MLNGLLVCSGCGRKMRAQAWGKNSKRAYRCTAKESKKVECAKTPSGVPAELIEGQFARIMTEFRLPQNWRGLS